MTEHRQIDDHRDAVALIRAHITEDPEAFSAIAATCDLRGVAEALITSYEMLLIQTINNPIGYLDLISRRLLDFEAQS